MMKVCAICGKEFEGFGNNPYPVRISEEARCCDDCNSRFVIMSRLMVMGITPEEKKSAVNILDSLDYEALIKVFNR